MAETHDEDYGRVRMEIDDAIMAAANNPDELTRRRFHLIFGEGIPTAEEFLERLAAIHGDNGIEDRAEMIHARLMSKDAMPIRMPLVRSIPQHIHNTHLLLEKTFSCHPVKGQQSPGRSYSHMV